MAIHQKTKAAITRAFVAGEKPAKVAERFGISYKTALRLRSQMIVRAETQPEKGGKSTPKTPVSEPKTTPKKSVFAGFSRVSVALEGGLYANFEGSTIACARFVRQLAQGGAR